MTLYEWLVENLLPAVIVEHVLVPYLPFSTQWHLTPENAKTMDRCAKQLEATIESGLEQLVGRHIWETEFRPMLIRMNAVIAGSFTLDMALGTNFATDVDVYVPVLFTPPQTSIFTPLEDWLWNRKDMFKYHDYDDPAYGHGLGSPVHWVRNYEFVANPSKRIQVIQILQSGLKQETLTAWVQRTFDFDCCKISYCPSNNLKCVEFPNLHDIMARKTAFQWNTNLVNSCRRRRKYETRGITFIMPDPDLLFRRFMDSVNREKLLDPIDVVLVQLVTDGPFEWKNFKWPTSTDPPFWFTLATTLPLSVDILGVWQPEDVELISSLNPILGKRKRSDEEERVLFRINLNSYSSKNLCEPNICIFEWCNRKHLHFRGHHIGHGSCRDLVFVVDPAL